MSNMEKKPEIIVVGYEKKILALFNKGVFWLEHHGYPDGSIAPYKKLPITIDKLVNSRLWGQHKVIPYAFYKQASEFFISIMEKTHSEIDFSEARKYLRGRNPEYDELQKKYVRLIDDIAQEREEHFQKTGSHGFSLCEEDDPFQNKEQELEKIGNEMEISRSHRVEKLGALLRGKIEDDVLEVILESERQIERLNADIIVIEHFFDRLKALKKQIDKNAPSTILQHDIRLIEKKSQELDEILIVSESTHMEKIADAFQKIGDREKGLIPRGLTKLHSRYKQEAAAAEALATETLRTIQSELGRILGFKTGQSFQSWELN